MKHVAVLALLVACWRDAPATEPSSPPPPTPDAPHVVRPDAPAPEPEPPPAPVAVPSPAATPTARCANGLIARVIGVRIEGQHTVATAARGARDGVTTAWTAILLTQPERSASILDITDTVTRVSVTATYDQIKPTPYVELCPPPLSSAPPIPRPPTNPCVIARVIATATKGSLEIATLSAGSNQGVMRSWTATQEKLNLPCKILRVDKTRSICETTATRDQLMALPRFTLCP